MSNKPLRRTQAIAPFGPGAIVDFPGPISLIHAGLDAYSFDPNNRDHDEFRISDEIRLAKRVGADYFVEPVEYRRSQPGGADYRNANLTLPFFRFPLWHVCPRCGRMKKSRLNRKDFPTCEGPIGSGRDSGKGHKKRRCYQVRFLTVCEKGHIADFPWIKWLFDGNGDPSDSDCADWVRGMQAENDDYWLRYRASGSAAASGIEIRAERMIGGKISVVRKKTMGNVFGGPELDNFGEGRKSERRSPLGSLPTPVLCDGSNPVLGIEESSARKPGGCGAQLYVSLKNASNLYFPSVYSSIFVPISDDSEGPEELQQMLDETRILMQLRRAALNNENDGLVTPRSAKRIVREFGATGALDESQLIDALVKAANSPKLLRHYLEMDPDVRDRIRRIDEAGDIPTLDDYRNWLEYLEWELDPALLVLHEEEQKQRPSDNSVDDEELKEELFRFEEHTAFMNSVAHGYPKVHLHVRRQAIKDYPDWMSQNFGGVSLLPRLRETRVFTGFHRINSTGLELGERKSLFREDESIGWLPGTVVRGEGLFIEFSADAIDKWRAKNISELQKKERFLFNAKVKLKRQDPKLLTVPSAEMVLIHTFAHIVINQLIYESGYGSASLRERIYVSQRTPSRMAGVLIYTAAGDTEGSMGGLVRLGEPDSLPQVIEDAVVRASWCSSDPVCGESKGQGLFGGNLAACHACSLLPETSCEHMNMFLDRSLLVGTAEDPELGFFNNLLGR